MERHRQFGPLPSARETVEEPAIGGRANLPQHPAAPALAQFPALNKPAAGFETAERVEGVETQGPQTPSTSFTAATLADTGIFPPDTMGAVGPTQYLLCVNGRIRVFDKNTGAIGPLDTTTDIFFQSVNNGSPTRYPRVRYDRLSGRWFVSMVNDTTPNRVVLAVSDTVTITGTTGWTFFFFQQELVSPPGNATCKADYPTLGIDANALYIGVNQRCGTPPALSGTTAFVVRKSSVIGPGPIVVTAFRNLTGTPSGAGLFAPHGVDNYDPVATEGYFIGVDNASFGNLVVRRVQDPGGTPTLSANAFIPVAATSVPITVRHQGNTGGSSGQLDAVDDRLTAAHIRNGRLWTSHNISVDNTGIATGERTRNAARWYEIQNVNTPTPTLVQSGTLFTSSATNTFDERNYWMPSVMVSGQGHMALGASIAGTNEFANAATAGRLAGDPLGTLQAPVALTAATTAYNPPGDTGLTHGSRRWGDYSYTSLDPCDDMTMWTVQEFSIATNSYGLQVVKLLAPPPAPPALANPSTIAPGAPSVNVTITGIPIGGSGYYDPGSGFGCSLSATVSGGVIVNSVTYQNPTTLVLNLSTAAATVGAKDVTITNPDGQSVTTSNLLNVNNTPCSFSLTPTSKSFPANGGNDSITVTAPGGCGWSAVKSESWITINSGGTGTGNGTVSYTVAANPTPSPRSATLTIGSQTFTVLQGANFADVPVGHIFYNEIGKLSARGITLGCGGGNFCPDQLVTRDQTAVFIVRAKGEFNPPTPGSQRFNDVPPTHPFYNFIDRLAALNITLGCGGGNFCPTLSVSRETMAAFIIRGIGEFNPPTPGSQRFNDVPPSNLFYNFIDRMAVLNITSGCSASPPLYCPSATATRGQMAVFLVKAFNL